MSPKILDKPGVGSPFFSNIPSFLSWPEKSRGLVSLLPGFLTWNAGTDLVTSAGDLYDVWMQKRLTSWAAASGTQILDRVRTLPVPHRQRLLSAPVFFALLRSKKDPDPESLQKLLQFLEVEEYLCGGPEPLRSGGWSALGDFQFVPGGNRPSQLPNAPAFHGIMIDTRSPWLDAGWMNPHTGPLAIHEGEELQLVLGRLRKSFDSIETASETVLRTITHSVSVIAAARGTQNPDIWSSMSARRIIGLTTLSNLQSNAWTDAAIADGLVHEAIHAVIYRIELFGSLYMDDSAGFRLKVTSPWSGRLLDLHSFVHACFVWFGLWNFWRLGAQRGFDSPDMKERARKGFMQGELAAILSPEAQANIRPNVSLAIEQMFEMVKKAPESEL